MLSAFYIALQQVPHKGSPPLQILLKALYFDTNIPPWSVNNQRSPPTQGGEGTLQDWQGGILGNFGLCEIHDFCIIVDKFG